MKRESPQVCGLSLFITTEAARELHCEELHLVSSSCLVIDGLNKTSLPCYQPSWRSYRNIKGAARRVLHVSDEKCVTTCPSRASCTRENPQDSRKGTGGEVASFHCNQRAR